MPKCKYCGAKNAEFQAGLSKFCNFEEAAKWAYENKAKGAKVIKKEEGKKDRAAKAVLNQNISYWRPKAQQAFNLFIRTRDRLSPCISCGCPHDYFKKNNYITGSPWDCGHYLSTGASQELRFSEDNAHKQCTKCNRQLSGNAVKYRARLLVKIGQYRVDVLEGPHVIPNWKWWHYEAVYRWYNTLNNKIKRELKDVEN